MRAVPYLLLAMLLVVAGCSRSSIVGKWDFPMRGLPMVLDFKADGTYSGTGQGGLVRVSGTYKVEGKVLALDPPKIEGPGGSVTPPGGQMRLEMKQLSPNAIALSAPNVNLTMNRIGK